MERPGKGDREPLADVDADLRDYIVSTVYSHLVGKEQRRRLGAFFTPPWLSSAVLNAVEDHGVDWSCVRVLDPASGGAAFVVPVARRMMTSLRAQGRGDADCVASLRERLGGVEIDPGLASLSSAFVETLLLHEFGLSNELVDGIGASLVRCADFLGLSEDGVAPQDHRSAAGIHNSMADLDVIVGNPPYGRPGPESMDDLRRRFSDIVSGALDLYAVFVRKALDHLRPGGLLAFVVPSSFLGGAYFSRFRAAVLDLASVERIDRVLDRKGVFVDVQHAVCLVVLRRRRGTTAMMQASLMPGAQPLNRPHFRCGVVRPEGRTECVPADMPAGDAPWVLPLTEKTKDSVPVVRPHERSGRSALEDARQSGLGAWLPDEHGPCLKDLGVQVRVGYYVPHRHSLMARRRSGDGRYPLFWECCILHDRSLDLTAPERTGRVAWVKPPEGAAWVHRLPCVIVQRTSRSVVGRRFHAAVVSEDVIAQCGGFVAENHVIVLSATNKCGLKPEEILGIITDPEFEAAYQERCGSISVSATLLSGMPVPKSIISRDNHQDGYYLR